MKIASIQTPNIDFIDYRLLKLVIGSIKVRTRILKFTTFLLFACFASASHATIVLNFEGINAVYPSTNYASVQDFYDGGTSSQGTFGTDYGVSFSSNALAICLNTIGATSNCSNTSRGGLGDPGSQKGGLFFLQGSQTFMNVAAGFDTGFSFFHTNINQAGSVSVYSDLNGTGTLLATLAIPTTPSTCSGYNAGFCPFVANGISFSGIAKSVSFAGVANQIVFDDITFGSATPGSGARTRDIGSTVSWITGTRFQAEKT